MSDWTDGYVTEVDYTYGYYQELNPLRLSWALTNSGFVPPVAGKEGLKVCELGFGLGMSLNMHAAAQPGSFWGTDFNPAQASFAQSLAKASGADAHLFDDAFAEFAEREGVPEFDVIGLHGIWSWVSDENRRVIVDFIRRYLKVGGAVYVSYNSLPGWANGMPLRQLMVEYSESMGAPGSGVVQRIDAALDFCQKLADTNPGAMKANPLLADRLARIKGQSRNYLAHEYFNRDWKPMYFSEMANWLQPAKLSFAASAFPFDHLLPINLTQQQIELYQSVHDPVLREVVKDFCVNQQFRRDIWVRGGIRLKPTEMATALRQQRVVLTENARMVELKANAALGEVSLNEAVYRPVIDALADHQPRTLAEIEKAVTGKMAFSQLREAITVLVGKGAITFAQTDEVASAQRKRTDLLNAAITRLSETRNDLSFLASPVTGGGVPVGRLSQLFLAARRAGRKSTREWAEYTWAILGGQGERLIKDGKTLETPEANLEELHLQAQGFSDGLLPRMRALQIA